MLGDEIVSRINQLGTISESAGNLTRIFLSPEHRTAADLLMSWMSGAGMDAHLDAIGNVCGRYEGELPGLPCLMLGSHYDTVRDAGRWDGPWVRTNGTHCPSATSNSATVAKFLPRNATGERRTTRLGPAMALKPDLSSSCVTHGTVVP